MDVGLAKDKVLEVRTFSVLGDERWCAVNARKAKWVEQARESEDPCSGSCRCRKLMDGITEFCTPK